MATWKGRPEWLDMQTLYVAEDTALELKSAADKFGQTVQAWVRLILGWADLVPGMEVPRIVGRYCSVGRKVKALGGGIGNKTRLRVTAKSMEMLSGLIPNSLRAAGYGSRGLAMRAVWDLWKERHSELVGVRLPDRSSRPTCEPIGN